MLSLHFAGWFQCRLATDPDPADEPRGVSGFTFAYPGEPDLDRVIRFARPEAQRAPVGRRAVRAARRTALRGTQRPPGRTGHGADRSAARAHRQRYNPR